jgi:hypothetical protein
VVGVITRPASFKLLPAHGAKTGVPPDMETDTPDMKTDMETDTTVMKPDVTQDVTDVTPVMAPEMTEMTPEMRRNGSKAARRSAQGPLRKKLRASDGATIVEKDGSGIVESDGAQNDVDGAQCDGFSDGDEKGASGETLNPEP